MINKTAKRLILFFSTITCFAATAIRIYQSLYYTDFDTGFLSHSKVNSAYIFYAVTIIGLIIAASFYFVLKKDDVHITYPHDKKLSGFSFAVAVLFFVDFLHQILNCYKYIEESDNMQMNMLIVMGLIGIAALVSCFYFITFGLSNSSNDYNFKNFGHLYLMPAAWAFLRLLRILADIISVKFAVDMVAEVIFLIVAIIFFGLFAVCVDSSENEKNFKRLTVIGFCLMFIGIVLTVPSLVSLIVKGATFFQKETRTNVTDLAISAFAGFFAFDTIIRLNKMEQK